DSFVFVVQGHPAPAAATRGTGVSAARSPLGTRGQVLQRVQVGAVRGTGQAVRLVARAGQDAVVLHIANGPALVLHPQTALALMRAQGGAVRGAGAEIAIPAQLNWPGLEQRGTTRGRLGSVLLSAVEVITGIALEPAARLTARKIAQKLDDQVDLGVYALNAQSLAAPLKGQ